MKKLASLFAFIIISNFLFAQFSMDTIQTKKGTKIINHEIGFNYQTFGGVFLGGSPNTLSLNLTYKKLLESGNAMRYSVNFERENNFFLGFNQNTIEITPTGKRVLNVNRDQNMSFIGIGWEYRKPTTNRHTLLVALDGLAGYRNVRENFHETIYNANGDSTYFAGNSGILIPEYDLDEINQLQSFNTHSITIGVRSQVGILWSITQRLLLSTSMEVRGLYSLNTRNEINNITGQRTITRSSNLDLNQQLLGDLSFYYRF